MIRQHEKRLVPRHGFVPVLRPRTGHQHNPRERPLTLGNRQCASQCRVFSTTGKLDLFLFVGIRLLRRLRPLIESERHRELLSPLAPHALHLGSFGIQLPAVGPAIASDLEVNLLAFDRNGRNRQPHRPLIRTAKGDLILLPRFLNMEHNRQPRAPGRKHPSPGPLQSP